MMSDDKNLTASFPAPSLSEWNNAASAEVAGGDPFDKLQWKTDDGPSFLPFYTAQHVDELKYLQNFSYHSGNDVRSRYWANMPLVTIEDVEKANTIALDHLQHEAEGIVFRVSGKCDFEKLLKDIAWEHCSVSFVVENNGVAQQLSSFILTSGNDLKKIQGALFRSPNSLPVDVAPFDGAFRLLGIRITNSTPVNEIYEALKSGAQIIDQYISKEIDLREVVNQIAFMIPVGTSLLLEIAKLKALRILWFQVVRAYGMETYDFNNLYLHGYSEPWINAKFQPHGNMLGSTIASIAAICGGCAAVTVQPEDEQNKTMNRIARNNAIILQEESHLGKVNDPFAGAYAVDVMTDAFAREAWKKFQSAV
jgi:methylmalonyl-CoA mutase